MNKNLQDGLENFDDGTMQLKNDIVVDNHKNRENGETLTGTSTIYQKQINSAQDLESNIPNLNNGIGQRINRKALIFLLLMGIVVVSIFMYAMSLFSTNDKANMEQVKEEVVDIPSSPIPSPALDETPAPVQQPTTNIDQQTELPTPPELVSVPAVPSVSSLQVPTIDSPVPSTVNESFGFKDSQDSGGISRSGGAGGFVISEDEGNTRGGGAVKRLQPQKLYKPDYLLVQGTYIRCVLMGRIVSDIPGNVSCIVTEPVYSSAGTKLLIPKGSKAIGAYAAGASVGNRIDVIWNRIITPNNLDIRMESQGTDSLGGNGHVGDYRSHWASRLGSAVLISLIGDGLDYLSDKNTSTNSVVTTSTSTTITTTETKTARTLERMAQQELNKMGMRPPTVTINQGEILNIFVSQDIDFENVIGNQ